ncbi:STAS domain-containing protein [Amycolatopsis sp., V23-08]|uniref:STAS domain-containing protein n=1 Tax=Amycolatopsis heterodermiae TaxID=3110235 RepID=A0ABU5R6W1_9PSEU|nr:STAS domain-containing protein [Amycolatopsis sp., V23-08]MEA5361011.1 STAS domain-containing protein [Amycolatopsis sp., V23-08]
MRVEEVPAGTGRAGVLRLTGVMGEDVAADQRQLIDAVVTAPPPSVLVLDLTGVTVLPASGIRMLLVFVDAVALRGIRCRVVFPDDGVVPRQLGVAGVLPARLVVFGTLEAALADVGADH